MVGRMLLVRMAVLCCGLLTSCVDKGQRANERVFIVGGDTISMSTVNRLVPDSLLRPKKIRRAALELSCSKAGAQCPDSERINRIGTDLAIQLSRQSQETWSPEAGRILYRAVRTIAARARQTNSLGAAYAFADSLFSVMIVSADSGSIGKIPKKNASLFNDVSPWQGDPVSLERLLSYLFDLPPGASRIVNEFLAAEEMRPAKAPDMSSMIKGLVYDSASKRQKKPQPKVTVPAVLQENSKEALRYRNKGSIKDSIEKHTADLEALYKKHLKVHEKMQGTLWVTFYINPSGEVESARIKTASITEMDFLTPFHDYVAKKIRFQPIPERAGTMSVEFPFEFAPEK